MPVGGPTGEEENKHSGNAMTEDSKDIKSADNRVGSQRFFAFWSFVDVFCARILVRWGLIDLFIFSVPLVEVTDASLEAQVQRPI